MPPFQTQPWRHVAPFLRGKAPKPPRRERTQPPNPSRGARGGWSSTAHTQPPSPAFHTHASASAPASQREGIGIYSHHPPPGASPWPSPCARSLPAAFIFKILFYFILLSLFLQGKRVALELGLHGNLGFSDTQWKTLARRRLCRNTDSAPASVTLTAF